MPRDVTDFFEQYRDAFNRLDGDAIADLFCVLAPNLGTFTRRTICVARMKVGASCYVQRMKRSVSTPNLSLNTA
jgi:hypothetical protein